MSVPPWSNPSTETSSPAPSEPCTTCPFDADEPFGTVRVTDPVIADRDVFLRSEQMADDEERRHLRGETLEEARPLRRRTSSR